MAQHMQMLVHTSMTLMTGVQNLSSTLGSRTTAMKYLIFNGTQHDSLCPGVISSIWHSKTVCPMRRPYTKSVALDAWVAFVAYSAEIFTSPPKMNSAMPVLAIAQLSRRLPDIWSVAPHVDSRRIVQQQFIHPRRKKFNQMPIIRRLILKGRQRQPEEMQRLEQYGGENPTMVAVRVIITIFRGKLHYVGHP